MWFEKKKLGKKWISLHLNEFNLKDGFENYIVAKIFNVPSNDKKVWKKKKNKKHNSTCYIKFFFFFFLLHYSKINKNKKFIKNCHIIEI